MPSNTAGAGVMQMFYIVADQPVNYIKLLLLRFGYFWGQVRPYYSVIHNATIVVFYLPAYFFALKGFRKILQHPIYTFMLTVMSLQTLMVMALAVDWDNRFMVPLLPYIFVFTSIGLTSSSTYNHVSSVASQTGSIV
ncbi:hypothetical protein [Pontibacter oryzae]|nr:hypothetical protein [Pontibacter oryzae]